MTTLALQTNDPVKALMARLKRALATLAPPPDLTVSQWADSHRQLSREASSSAGKWDTDFAPYQRGPMDAIKDPTVETVVFMASAQVGKTEIVNNIIGYGIDQDPGPMLVIQPTLEMAQAWSKDRLAPMLRDTPCLVGKVAEPRAKDANNTILHKQFPGGHLTVVGANSPAGLASRPIRWVLADEIDRYESSAGREGDPVYLAQRRTQTFHDRKVVLISTPTESGTSRIEAAYKETDQRVFFVPCPGCGRAQELKWSQVRWPKDDFGRHLVEQTYYQCIHCGAKWDEADRRAAVSKGQWVAQAEFRGRAGFRVNQLYSPWTTLAEIAKEFRLAHESRNPERLKTFWNTVMGEVWQDLGEGIETPALLSRREIYEPGKLPEGVLLITASADVQDSRIEVEVRGWGVGEEGWGIEKLVLPGDPAAQPVWDDLEQVLRRTYLSSRGYSLPITAMAVDSGGHHTQRVYQWCRRHAGRRVMAIKGVGGYGKPLLIKTSIMRPSGAVLLPLGVDEAKMTLYAYLKLATHGPGYQHFPVEHGYDQEHFEQLTSEVRYQKYTQGVASWGWKKKKAQARNEALDLWVYCYGMLQYLKPNWAALKANADRRAAQAPTTSPDQPAPEAPRAEGEVEKRKAPPMKPPRRPGGWVNGWRG